MAELENVSIYIYIYVCIDTHIYARMYICTYI